MGNHQPWNTSQSVTFKYRWFCWEKVVLKWCRSKNYDNFIQEVKTTKEYQNFKDMEKKGYEKIIKDTAGLMKRKDDLSNAKSNLIEPLLRIEGQKQTLQTAIMAYEEESNVKIV